MKGRALRALRFFVVNFPSMKIARPTEAPLHSLYYHPSISCLPAKIPPVKSEIQFPRHFPICVHLRPFAVPDLPGIPLHPTASCSSLRPLRSLRLSIPLFRPKTQDPRPSLQTLNSEPKYTHRSTSAPPIGTSKIFLNFHFPNNLQLPPGPGNPLLTHIPEHIYRETILSKRAFRHRTTGEPRPPCTLDPPRTNPGTPPQSPQTSQIPKNYGPRNVH